MNTKALLYAVLEFDRLYTADQIRRRLRDAGHSEEVFAEGVAMEWLIHLETIGGIEFWTIDQHK